MKISKISTRIITCEESIYMNTTSKFKTVSAAVTFHLEDGRTHTTVTDRKFKVGEVVDSLFIGNELALKGIEDFKNRFKIDEDDVSMIDNTTTLEYLDKQCIIDL